MEQEKAIIVLLGQDLTGLDPQQVASLPERHKEVAIEGTANSIAQLMVMEQLFPQFVNAGGPSSTKQAIEARKNGLKMLGVDDIDQTIKDAQVRVSEADAEGLMVQAILLLSGMI